MANAPVTPRTARRPAPAQDAAPAAPAHIPKNSTPGGPPRITKRRGLKQAQRKVRPTPERVVKLRVRATEIGYYRHIRRREGDVFVITLPVLNDTIELPSWVDQVDPKAPLRITTGTEALDELRMQNRRAQQELKQKMIEDVDEAISGDASEHDEQ